MVTDEQLYLAIGIPMLFNATLIERPPTNQEGLLSRMRNVNYLVLVVLGLLIAAKGLGTLSQGHLVYYNYRQLAVYAPFPVFIGVCVPLVVLWRSKRQTKLNHRA